MHTQHNTLLSTAARYISLNVMGMLGLSCYILADTYFISAALGAPGLTALNLVLPLYGLLNGLALMLGMGGATRFAIAQGRAQPDHARAAFTHTLILALIVGGLATLVAPLSGVILPLLGADAGIAPLGIAYLGALFPFSCAFMLNNVLVCFMRNAGHPRLAMAAMLVGSLSNILLDYLFLFPLGWGMAGAAAATGLAPCLGILTLAPVCLGKKSPLRLCQPHLTARKIKHLLSPGLPSLVNEASVALVMALFNSIILGLAGNLGVAAYGIVANLALVATAMLTGVAQGIQPLISRAYGAGDCAAILQARRIAMVTALIFGALFTALAQVFPAQLTGLFNAGQDAALGNLATQGIRLYFTAYPFMGFNVILAAYWASTGRGTRAFWFSLGRSFILVAALSLLLSALWGMPGVWLTVPCAEALFALAGLFYMKSRKSSKPGTFPPPLQNRQ